MPEVILAFEFPKEQANIKYKYITSCFLWQEYV